MSKEKAISKSGFFSSWFEFEIYKPSQGKVSRQLTCGVVWLICFLACWALHEQLTIVGPKVKYYVPGCILLLGAWIGFRVVNLPNFADFLIAVQAEMNKVSWPTRGELIRASIVVIVVIFILATVLFGFDVFWKFFFVVIGVLKASN